MTSLSHAVTARHPLLTELGPSMLVGGEPRTRLAWFLDALITGIREAPPAGDARRH